MVEFLGVAWWVDGSVLLSDCFVLVCVLIGGSLSCLVMGTLFGSLVFWWLLSSFSWLVI